MVARQTNTNAVEVGLNDHSRRINVRKYMSKSVGRWTTNKCSHNQCCVHIIVVAGGYCFESTVVRQNNHELWSVIMRPASVVCLRARRFMTERCWVGVNEPPPPSPQSIRTSLGVTLWLAVTPWQVLALLRDHLPDLSFGGVKSFVLVQYVLLPTLWHKQKLPAQVELKDMVYWCDGLVGALRKLQ